MATIGLRDVYYATLTTDTPTTATYAAPVRIIGAISASVNANTSSETLFADDGPFETATTMGEITIELNIADLDMKTLAAITGATYDSTSKILKQTSDDTPPYLALGYRTLKPNGAYRYYWLVKGKFNIPEDSFNTKGDSIEFQTPTISGNFVKRDQDSAWKISVDEDDTPTASVITNWFTATTLAFPTT
jgi:phi13 family phage major tail protein